MNQPLLHVMIPAYGKSPYLRKTLESAVKNLSLDVLITVVEDPHAEFDLKKIVDDFVNSIFKRNKEVLLKEFLNHSITVELKNGPNSENISNTLGGEGNLFSFLGFFYNTNPTLSLENLFNNLSIRKTTRRGNVIYYSINLPTNSEIANSTKMDWGSGTSWAYAVENGNFNGDAALSHYIYKTWIKGRSKTGIQVKQNYSERNFSPKPYISEILENFQKRMNNINV